MVNWLAPPGARPASQLQKPSGLGPSNTDDTTPPRQPGDPGVENSQGRNAGATDSEPTIIVVVARIAPAAPEIEDADELFADAAEPPYLQATSTSTKSRKFPNRETNEAVAPACVLAAVAPAQGRVKRAAPKVALASPAKPSRTSTRISSLPVVPYAAMLAEQHETTEKKANGWGGFRIKGSQNQKTTEKKTNGWGGVRIKGSKAGSKANSKPAPKDAKRPNQSAQKHRAAHDPVPIRGGKMSRRPRPQKTMKSSGRGASMYRGVSWDNRSGKWLSSMTLDGRRLYLGTYDNELEAAKAFNVSAKKVGKTQCQFLIIISPRFCTCFQ